MITEYFSEKLQKKNFIFTDIPSGDKIESINVLRSYESRWSEAFPDLQGTISFKYECKNISVYEFLWHGVHEGNFIVTDGIIPPTGKTVKFATALIISDEDSEPLKLNHYYDLITILDQLSTPEH